MGVDQPGQQRPPRQIDAGLILCRFIALPDLVIARRGRIAVAADGGDPPVLEQHGAAGRDGATVEHARTGQPHAAARGGGVGKEGGQARWHPETIGERCAGRLS
ncbi:MAG TPA: hypothetical protein VKV27_12595 [Solirubrobacteraceae bacterium]|nr:hypothetical protein [Solirubrobacteraceae bacterium]